MPIRAVLLLCGTLSLAGCVEFRHKFSIVRLLVDHNSQNAPAITWERLSREPDEPGRVDSYRWMYNRPVGKRVDEWQRTRSVGVAQIQSVPVAKPMTNPPEAPLSDVLDFDTNPAPPPVPPPIPKAYPQSHSSGTDESVANSHTLIQRTSGSQVGRRAERKPPRYSWLFTTPSPR